MIEIENGRLSGEIDQSEIVLSSMLAFARQGIAVFPIFGITEGVCDCGDEACEHKGKHPVSDMVRNGVKGATTDRKTIKNWHAEYPTMNYGVATRGIAVVDTDSASALQDFRKSIKPPLTLRVKTSRGYHFYFRGEVRTRTGVRPNLDIKSGEGSYVVGPGSLHESGSRYILMDDVPLAEVSEAIKQLSEEGINGPAMEAGKPLPIGMRNKTLTKFAGYLQANNVPAEAILDGLLALNQNISAEPLSKKEVRGIVKSITSRYPAKALPNIRSFDEIDEEKLDWIWYPYICRGTLGLLDGNPGEGKSQFAIWLAAMLGRGDPLPGNDALPPMNTFLLNMEDLQGATIKPRLKANDAVMGRVFIQDKRFQLTPELVEWLEGEIARYEADLVILDPIQAFIKPGVDVSSNVEVRDFMSQLSDVAERQNCAIVCVRHFGKSAHDKAMKKGIGSTDFVGISRNQFGLAKRDDGQPGFFVFHMKTNFEKGRALVFNMSEADGRNGEQPKISFDTFSNLTEDEFFSPERGKRGPPQDERELAKQMLRDVLLDGPKRVKALNAKAKSRGISVTTLHRAHQDLKIKSVREGKVWYWALPEA